MSRLKLAIIVCGFSFLTGCFWSQSRTPREKEFETIHLLGTVGVHEMVVELIEDELAAAGIKIEKNFFYWDTYMAKARLAIMNETGEYDVIMGPGCELVNFARSGKVIALNDIAERSGLRPDALYPQILKDVMVDGSFYVLPYLADALIYIYRRDLFARTGITPPVTISAMYRLARKMTTGSVYGLAFPASPYDTVTSVWSYFLWSSGGDYFDDDWRPVIDSPQSMAATRVYTLLLQECAPPSVATWRTEETVDFFAGGELAAMLLWSGVSQVLENSEKSRVAGKVGYAPLPVGATNRAVSPFGHWGIVIPRAARHIIAAKKFAESLVAVKTFKAIAEAGMAPTPIPEINREYARKYPEKPLAVATKLLEVAKERPQIPEAGQYIPIIGSALNDILIGAKLRTTLEEANKQISELMKAGGYYRNDAE